MNKACVKHLELTAYRLNLKDLLSGSSAPMFAVGCNNCHCPLFFAGTHNTTTHIFKLPVMRDEHQGLSTMPNRNLETTRGWSSSARTHITTHISHTHTSWRKGDMRLRLWWSRIVIFHYIQLLGLCKVC